MSIVAIVLVFLLGMQSAPVPIAPDEEEAEAVPGAAPRYVILDQHVKNVLAADWDAHATDPAILERAYCVTYQKDLWVIPEFVWRAVEIEPATAVIGATPNSIESFSCPDAPNVTTAHVHPNQSCLTDSDCVNGGTLALQCFPSDTDLRTLRKSGQPFALIVCARDVAVAYWP